ncbi:MAG: lysophospholipid acyltransferase family protein [Deltaproteobacteria bacterium]|nr:lysophospholipid acyltransferase family protein [Deltaproteobacteria bacterium]MBW2360000.1 lysophospholipid acyltransferase family protein [Deltaproteobacteria bacterium]
MRRWLAGCFLRLSGWEPEGVRPTEARFVLIAAPHTSNWDMLFLFAMAGFFDVKIRWMGKHVLFHWPLGWFLRKLGGVPVVRHKAGNMVEQMAQLLRDADSLALVIPVEGTRGYVPHWKSGFYHIACAAGVPIVMSYLDYARKCGGFGPALLPTGDLRSDMDEIREFYAGKVGRHPDQFGAVRLKEEM